MRYLLPIIMSIMVFIMGCTKIIDSIPDYNNSKHVPDIIYDVPDYKGIK